MSVGISGRISTHLNNTSLHTPTQPPVVPSIAQQIQQNLFGRPRPPRVDPRLFPELAACWMQLRSYRRKLALLAGDQDDDYTLVLADDTIAAIDEHGHIFMGAAFLKGHVHRLAVLVGVLAHEVGHRPKRWRHRRYARTRQLTLKEIQALCRHEETCADMFAGQALAELGMGWEPLAELLMEVHVHPHPEYLPVSDRIGVIQEAYEARRYRIQQRKKVFPVYDFWSSPVHYIGEF